MDIRPVRQGQLLVIPKLHVDHFLDLTDGLATSVFLVGQRLARVIRQVLAPQRVGMIVHGFGVPHAHLVLVPLQQASDITAAQFAVIEGDRIVFRWETVPITPREELETLADLLRREAVRSEPAPEEPTAPRQHSRFL